MLALAVAETRTLWRSPRSWVSAAAVLATGLAAYHLLAQLHATLWVYASGSGFVSPRFLIHAFGLAPLWLLLFGLVLFAFDNSHRDQRSGIAEVLHARPASNLIWLAGRFTALLATGVLLLLLTLGAIQTLGMLARAFAWPVGDLIEPVSLFAFVVVEALPALAGWCALVLLLTAALPSRVLVLCVATGVLVGQHWLLHAVPTYLLPIVSPLPSFGTIASDVLPTFADRVVLAQRVLVLLLAGGLLTAAAACHPRPDGRRSWRLTAALAAAALVVAGSAGLTLLVARSTDAMALRDHWHVAQQLVDREPRADLERIEGLVRIEPARALTLDLELTLSAPAVADPAADLVFSFNPAMKIHRLLVDGGPAEHRHESGLLLVRPTLPFGPGAEFVLSLGATGVPDPGFAYLDEAVDALAENWKDSQLPFLGTVASVFEDSYVALMPGTRWLPQPGPNLAVDQAHRRQDHFAIDLEVDVPPGWHVAAPGLGRATGNPNRRRFRPTGPMAEVTVVAAPFERYRTVVDDVEFELLLHPAHTRNADLLADMAGTEEAVVARLKEFLADARRYGIPYPYDGLSIVEVPARLRLYGGGWRMEGLRSGPGVLLMREHGFPTARLNRAALSAQTPVGQAAASAGSNLNAVLQYFVWDRVGGNLVAGATDNLLPLLLDVRGRDADLAKHLLASLTSMQFGIRRAPFSALAFTDSGLARTSKAANPGALSDRLMAFASGLAGRYAAATGWDLEHPSLWERATSSAWSDIAPGNDPHHALATKSLLGNVIALSTWHALERDGVASLLATVRSRYEGGALATRDLVAAARQGGTVDPPIEEWANMRPAPGLVASPAVVRRLADDDSGGGAYHVSVKVRNEGAAPGMMRLVLGTDPGNGSAWLHRRSSKAVRVRGHSSVELGMVSDARPLDAWLASFFSQNRADMRLELTVLRDERLRPDDAPHVGSRPTSWRPPAEVGVVVDDLDPGFAVESARLAPRLAARFAPKNDAMLLDHGIPAYRQALGEGGHMPASGVPRPEWSRQEFGAAWGRYRRTIARAVGGDGLDRAVFTARLPTAGRWHLEYHVPDLSRRPRRTGLQSWTITGDWDGGRIGTLDLTLAARGKEDAVTFDAGFRLNRLEPRRHVCSRRGRSEPHRLEPEFRRDGCRRRHTLDSGRNNLAVDNTAFQRRTEAMIDTTKRIALAAALVSATVAWSDEAAVMRKLAEAAPHLTAASISASPVGGIHEVEIKEDLSRLYITSDGNFLSQATCTRSPRRSSESH